MPDEIWSQGFPYRGGTARVARTPRGWRLALDAGEAEATTLVEAFEQLLGRWAGGPEMHVVMAALAKERTADSSDGTAPDVVDGDAGADSGVPSRSADDTQPRSA